MFNYLMSEVVKIKNRIKALFPVEFVQFINRKRKVLKSNQFEELRRLERFTESRFVLNSKVIKIPDAASFLFMYSEIFEQEIYKFKSRNDAPYIIDAGANIGLSVIYFKELFPNAEIVAFEPDENIFQFLSDNVSERNYNNVNLIPKGLWDSETTLRFKAEGADGGAIIQNKATAENETSIKVVSLKSYLQRPVDFLKIDIEGAELKVLRDIKDLLHQVDNIFVEYHSFVDKEQCLHEIINILTESGFRLYTSNPGNVSVSSPYLGLSNYNGMDYQLNIFGFRNH